MTTPTDPQSNGDSRNQQPPSGEPENTGQGQPRFGQRSAHWSAESAEESGPSTPWPQYGQTPGASSGGPSWPSAGESPSSGTGTGAPGQGPAGGAQQQNWPQYGQGGSGWGAPPAGGPTPAGPGATPYGAPPYGYQTGAPGAPAGLQPSRTGPVVLIVVGAVLALLVAPAVFVAVILGSIDYDRLSELGAPVTSGSEVTVDESGSYLVVSTDSSALTCTLTGSDGSVLELTPVQGEESVAAGTGIPAGTYTLDCGDVSGTLVGMTGQSIEGFGQLVVRAAGWATLIGVIGVVLLIVGIVRLVRVNRRRRETSQSSYWTQPPPGGGAPYPPSQY